MMQYYIYNIQFKEIYIIYYYCTLIVKYIYTINYNAIIQLVGVVRGRGLCPSLSASSSWPCASSAELSLSTPSPSCHWEEGGTDGRRRRRREWKEEGRRERRKKRERRKRRARGES